MRERRRLVDAIAGGRAELAQELAEQHVHAQTERLIRLRLQLDPPAPGRPRPHAPEELFRDVADELERIFTALDGLGNEFAALVARVGDAARTDDLVVLRPTILSIIAAHDDLVTGAGIVAAPGLLANAPHWLEWWWASRRGVPEALRVNLDPSAPDFYDYATTDWYATPRDTREPAVAGPYVDHACTNAYAITVSSPVRSRDGAMLGIAAADMLVARLERRLLPVLAGFDGAAAVTNGDGRVIASNSSLLLPGQRLPAGGRVVRALSSRPSTRAWQLVEL